MQDTLQYKRKRANRRHLGSRIEVPDIEMSAINNYSGNENYHDNRNANGRAVFSLAESTLNARVFALHGIQFDTTPRRRQPRFSAMHSTTLLHGVTPYLSLLRRFGSYVFARRRRTAR